MRALSTLCVIASSLLVANASNTITTPALGDNVYAKNSLNVTWKPDTPGPVTITLRFGAPNTLSPGTTIAKSVQNSGSLTWPVPEAFGSGIYTVEIKDDKTSALNYSPLFSISGGLGIQGSVTLPIPLPTLPITFVNATSSSAKPTSTSRSGADGVFVGHSGIFAMLGAGALALL